MDNKTVLQNGNEDKHPGESPAATSQSDAVAQTQQPAAFQYRYFINPLVYNSIPYYGYMNYGYHYPKVQQGYTQNFIAAPPVIYTPQKFDNEKLFRSMYGTEASKRDRRKYRKYLRSEQYASDVDKFNDMEHRKYLDSLHNYTTYLNTIYNNAQNPQTTTTSKYASDPHFDYWTAEAKKFGFESMDEVAGWQRGNGLKMDGKMGPQSKAFYMRIKGASPVNTSVISPKLKNTTDSKTTVDSKTTGDSETNTDGIPKNLQVAADATGKEVRCTTTGIWFLIDGNNRLGSNGSVLTPNGRSNAKWGLQGNKIVYYNK